MIYCVTGKLIATEPELAVVSCGGVGYACRTSMNTLAKISSKSEVTLYTHLSVREDAVELFGFADKEELNWFKLLITVSGIGPAVAISILSGMTASQLAVAIASSDVSAFTKIKGLGKKKAQLIIVALQSKVTTESQMYAVSDDYSAVQTEGSTSAEAVEALVALGYTQSEAATVIAKMGKGLTVEEYVMRALKEFSPKNI